MGQIMQLWWLQAETATQENITMIQNPAVTSEFFRVVITECIVFLGCSTV